jgi:hypothetical protein
VVAYLGVSDLGSREAEGRASPFEDVRGGHHLLKFA